MAPLTLVAVGVLALLVFVLFGALIELYRDVRQLRDVAGILDRPLNVDLGPVAGSVPSSHGLPVELDAAASAMVLFLSDRCGTCRALAASFDKTLPAGLWVVVEAGNAHAAAHFLESYGLAPMTSTGRVTVDVEGRIARSIGLDTTPVGFRIENARIASATTVPSSRYLRSVLPNPVRLRSSSGNGRRVDSGSSTSNPEVGPRAASDGDLDPVPSSTRPLSRMGMTLLSAAVSRRRGGD